MKYTLLLPILFLALPLTPARAESVETHIYSTSNSSGFVESRVETSGNSEVRVRTVINGEVVEDVHIVGGKEVGREEPLNQRLRELVVEDLPEPPVYELNWLEIDPETLEVRLENAEDSDPLDPSSSPAEGEESPLSLKADALIDGWSASIFQAINNFIQKLFSL